MSGWNSAAKTAVITNRTLTLVQIAAAFLRPQSSGPAVRASHWSHCPLLCAVFTPLWRVVATHARCAAHRPAVLPACPPSTTAQGLYPRMAPDWQCSTSLFYICPNIIVSLLCGPCLVLPLPKPRPPVSLTTHRCRGYKPGQAIPTSLLMPASRGHPSGKTMPSPGPNSRGFSGAGTWPPPKVILPCWRQKALPVCG